MHISIRNMKMYFDGFEFAGGPQRASSHARQQNSPCTTNSHATEQSTYHLENNLLGGGNRAGILEETNWPCKMRIIYQSQLPVLRRLEVSRSFLSPDETGTGRRDVSAFTCNSMPQIVYILRMDLGIGRDCPSEGSKKRISGSLVAPNSKG